MISPPDSATNDQLSDSTTVPTSAAPTSTSALSSEHQQYLTDRAVPLSFAVAAGLRTVDGAEAARDLRRAAPIRCDALCIPYPGVTPSYRRYRMDDPEVVGGARYLTMPDREVPVYVPQVPPATTISSSSTASASTGTALVVPPSLHAVLVVVESPIKALALRAAGLNAVGLGGTATTLSKKHGERELNSSWGQLQLAGKNVVVLMDAGRRNNPNVARDEARLALALRQAGAVVSVAALPLDGAKDQGPDDFLAKQGAQALWSVIADALPSDPAERVRRAVADAASNPNALNDLLDDLAFGVSLAESSPGVLRAVKDEFAKAKVKASDVAAAKKQAEKRMKASVGAPRTKTTVGSFNYAVVGNAHQRLDVTLGDKNGDGSDDKDESIFLSNFAAKFVKEVTYDFGGETDNVLEIEGVLADGTPLPRKRVRPDDLRNPLWPVVTWGARAQVAPERAAAAELVLAIQQNSSPERHTVYGHTGWTTTRDLSGVICGDEVFVHAGGAVGAENVLVELSDQLAHYRLPTEADDAAEAVRLSLSLEFVAPAEVTVPLLGATAYAPLCSIELPRFALNVVGKTGALKTSLVRAFLAHEGERLLDESPANFTDSVAAIEAKLHRGKDVLFLVDDCKPATAHPRDEMRLKVNAILSALGNGEGRGRMRSDGVERPSRPPRCMAVVTSEVPPDQESAVARTVTLELKKGDVKLKALSAVQSSAPRLPHARLAYLQWLRPRLAGLRSALSERVRLRRGEFAKVESHLRIPDALARLAVALDLYAEFAVDVGAITAAEAEKACRRWKKVLERVSSVASAAPVDPAQRFIELFRELLVQGKVELEHNLATPLGGPDIKPGATRIGWEDKNKNEVLVLPSAGYRAVAEGMARSNEAFPLTERTLWKRLAEARLIAAGDRAEHLTQRRSLGGDRVPVIVFARDLIYPPEPPEGGGGVPSDGKGARSGAASRRVRADGSGPSSVSKRPIGDTDRTTPGADRDAVGISSPPFFNHLEREEKGALSEVGPEGPVGRSGRGEEVEESARGVCQDATANDVEKSGLVPAAAGPTGPVLPSVFLMATPAPTNSPQPRFRFREVGRAWTALTTDSARLLQGRQIVAHGALEPLRWLQRNGVTPGSVRCTQTAARLLTGESETVATFERVAAGRAVGDADALLRLHHSLEEELCRTGLSATYELECEVLPVVAQMAEAGVGIDGSKWISAVGTMRQRAAALRGSIQEKLQVENPDHADAVLRALGKVGVAVNRTGAAVLLRHTAVPGINEYLEYRRVTAFLNDLGGKLEAMVKGRNFKGRVHCDFDPLGATTGRFCCSTPNLLALPRTPEIRSCVVPASGNAFIVADYAAIDLRALAHVTGDERLREVFVAARDPHLTTAALLLGKPENEVTRDERQRAKPVNFGVAFGMGDESLVEYAFTKFGVELAVGDAAAFRQRFLINYPGVAEWQRAARQDGRREVRTALGRRRLLTPGSSGYTQRLATEVQGTAADGMKRAMVLVARELAMYGARLILPVHDELLVEAPVECSADVLAVVRNAMIAGMASVLTSVPIEVDADIRSSWAEDSGGAQ